MHPVVVHPLHRLVHRRDLHVVQQPVDDSFNILPYVRHWFLYPSSRRMYRVAVLVLSLTQSLLMLYFSLNCFHLDFGWLLEIELFISFNLFVLLIFYGSIFSRKTSHNFHSIFSIWWWQKIPVVLFAKNTFSCVFSSEYIFFWFLQENSPFLSSIIFHLTVFWKV